MGVIYDKESIIFYSSKLAELSLKFSRSNLNEIMHNFYRTTVKEVL